MLEFNPGFRPTAKECLKNKIFDKIRNKKFECDAPFKIIQEIFMPDVYDYTNEKHLLYTNEDYKQMLFHEIELFKNEI